MNVDFSSDVEKNAKEGQIIRTYFNFCSANNMKKLSKKSSELQSMIFKIIIK